MFGGLAVDLIGEAQSKEPAQGFLVLCRDMDRGEMAAAVEPGKHHGVAGIGLATVTGLSGNKRGGDNIAVKSILGKDSLENEAGAGRFVAGPNRSFFGKTPKEAADFHEVPGKLNDFGILGIAFENGGGNRIGVHIETDVYILIHGWIPPKKCLSAKTTHVALVSENCSTDQPTINGGSSRFYVI
jgi:hypothetical protein